MNRIAGAIMLPTATAGFFAFEVLGPGSLTVAAFVLCLFQVVGGIYFVLKGDRTAHRGG